MEETTFVSTNRILISNASIPINTSQLNTLPEATGISKEFNDIYRNVMGSIVYPAICLFGLIGNSFGLVVLWRDIQKQTNSTFRYMMALIAFDTALLLTGLAQGLIYILEHIDSDRMNGVNAYFRVGKAYTDFVFFHSTSVLIIVMAVERLNATIRPLAYKETALARYPTRMIFIIFGVFLVLNLPTAISFEVTQIYVSDVMTYAVIVKPSFVESFDKYITAEALASALYFVVLAIANTAIAIAYVTLQRKRKKSLPSASSRSSHTGKVTVLVYWISFMYILNSWPRITHHLLTYTDKEYTHFGAKRYTQDFILLNWDISTRLNAANDFFIYFMLYERYRNVFCNCFSKAVSRNTTQETKSQ